MESTTSGSTVPQLLSPKYDMVVFDWKGTLQHKGRTKAIREQNSLKEVVAVLGEELGGKFKEHYQQQKAKAKELEEKEHIYITKAQLLDRALESAGITDLKLRESGKQAFLKLYNKPVDGKKKSLAPGAADLLSKLREHENLEEVDAHHFFDVEKNVVLSGEVGVGKPHKKIFQGIVDKMQTHHIPPERVLYIGDEPDLDVVGGKNVGWNTVLIRSNHPSSDGRAHFEIDSLHELHHIIFEKQQMSLEIDLINGKEISFEIEEVTVEFDE